MDVNQYPTRYQMNTRVWTDHRMREIGRPVTPGDISSPAHNHYVYLGLDWICLLGFLQAREAERAVSHSNPDIRKEIQTTWHDLQEGDTSLRDLFQGDTILCGPHEGEICGSCYLIKVNYGSIQGQYFVQLPFDHLGGKMVHSLLELPHFQQQTGLTNGSNLLVRKEFGK